MSIPAFGLVAKSPSFQGAKGFYVAESSEENIVKGKILQMPQELLFHSFLQSELKILVQVRKGHM